VEVTGGLVAADKSNFYHIQWEFSNGNKRPIANNDRETLTLSQGDGGRREIKKLGNYEEHKTLGCWVNPLGTQIQAYKQMYNFVNTWRGRMLHSGLSPKLIRQSYNTELLSQLKYRLSVYMFTEPQCEELMKIINPVILHSHFLNKNYPRSLMQANEQYGGLSIAHLYDVMGMEKSKFLLMHMRRNDTTAKLLTIAMQNLQLECGTEELFFNLDFDEFSSMATNGWLKNLWEYYDSRAIRVDEDLNVKYKKPREGDNFLMDILGKYKSEITPKQMEQINKVRQYLGLLTLADVADVRGRRLLQQVKRGQLKCRKTNFDFAPQSPTKAWIKVWREIACPIFEREISCNPLGQWIATTHQTWTWVYSSTDEVLRNECGETYKKRTNVYVEQDFMDQVPNDQYDEVVDVDFSKSEHPFIIGKVSCKKMYQNEEGRNTEKSINEPADKVLVEYLRPSHVFEKVLEDNLCVVATDGSNKNDEGALAWCCANKQTGEILVKGRGRVSCAKTDSSSLRPELATLINVIQFLNRNNKKMGNDCAISIHTDSANAIADMKLGYYPTTKNVFENNIDMKIKLKNLLRMSPFQINLEFVEAHQDRLKPWDELDMPARLNCYVDKYAGGTYDDVRCGKHEEQVQFFPELRISLSLPFTRPTANCVKQLTSFCNGHKAESQLARYWKIKEQWLGNIEWDGLRKAIKRNRNNNKGMQCKLIHKQWPTMKMMKRNGMSLTSLCPLCGKVEESWEHVFQCDSQIATIERQKQVANLRLALEKKKTNPILVNRILSAILQWTKKFPMRSPTNFVNEENVLEQAFQDQNRLRCGNMFCGVVTKYFGDVQDAYYKHIGATAARLNRQEWNVHFIRSLLNFSMETWNARCEYVHEGQKVTIEAQVRNMAQQLRYDILANPWKLRIQDRHLLKRNSNFFRGSTLVNVKYWIDRIILGIDIAQNHEAATTQNITKWILKEGDKYTKHVKMKISEVQRKTVKYVQQKLDFTTCNDIQRNSNISSHDVNLMDKEMKLMEYDEINVQEEHHHEMGISATDDECETNSLEAANQLILESRTMRSQPTQTLMSLERDAMYPEHTSPWDHKAIHWTSESENESIIGKKQCKWILQKRPWQPKVTPTTIFDHFTNDPTLLICQNNRNTKWRNTKSFPEESSISEKRVWDQKREEETIKHKRKESEDGTRKYVAQSQGSVSATINRNRFGGWVNNAGCTQRESVDDDRGKFLVEEEDENTDTRATLDMGQSIECVISVTRIAKRCQSPRRTPTRRKLTKSFVLPHLGKMSSFRSNKIWDSEASQSVEGEESVSRSKSSLESITSFDQYFKSLGIQQATRGNRYDAQMWDESSSDTSQDCTPNSRRFLRNSNRTIELMEEEECEISDLCESDGSTSYVEGVYGGRILRANTVRRETNECELFNTMSNVNETSDCVTSVKNVHRCIRATRRKDSENDISLISSASLNFRIQNKQSMEAHEVNVEEDCPHSSVCSQRGSSTSLWWNNLQWNEDEVIMRDMGDGEIVQEVETVEDLENEDEQVQDIQIEVNDQPDVDNAIPRKYIPVYFNLGAKTVATPESLLQKIKIIYEEADYVMHEDVLGSLQDESKGQLRIYIRQLHKLIQSKMQEAIERQQAIFETEKIYVRKKDEVLQILLKKKARLGQFYEAQDVANYRRHSMDYLLSMVGLVDIDLQEQRSQEAMEHESIAKHDEKFNLCANLELPNNLP